MAKYLHSNTKQKRYKIGSGDDFAIGDHVFCDASDSFFIKPAADFTWNSTLAQTQADFCLRYAGVVMATYTGSTFSSGGPNEYGLQQGEVMVYEDGVFEENCASATFNTGTLVGMAKQSGNALESQKVVQTSTEVTSIGRVYAPATSSTKVKIAIDPNLSKVTTAADSGS